MVRTIVQPAQNRRFKIGKIASLPVYRYCGILDASGDREHLGWVPGRKTPSADHLERSGQTLKKVGFIGLGIMGKPMALNLRKAGVALMVSDLNPTVWRR